jgi:hypothetical protein
MDILIVAVAFLAVAIPIVGLFVLIDKLTKKSRLKQKQKDESKLERYSHTHDGIYKHVEGLPFTSGVSIVVYYGAEKFTFKKDSQEVVLKCDKIISLDTCFGKDVNNQAAKGAVAGKILIGGLGGAALGALMASTLYFVITYKKDEKSKFIVLDTALSGLLSDKIIKDFKKNHHRETETIEL